MANADVRLEDLLQAQYQDRASLSLFNGVAKFNLNLFLYQINKKWVYHHRSVHVSELVYFSGFMYEYLLLSYHVPLAACLVSHTPSYSRHRSTRSGSASLIAVEFEEQHRQPICIFVHHTLGSPINQAYVQGD